MAGVSRRTFLKAAGIAGITGGVVALGKSNLFAQTNPADGKSHAPLDEQQTKRILEEIIEGNECHRALIKSGMGTAEIVWKEYGPGILLIEAVSFVKFAFSGNNYRWDYDIWTTLYGGGATWHGSAPAGSDSKPKLHVNGPHRRAYVDGEVFINPKTEKGVMRYHTNDEREGQIMWRNEHAPEFSPWCIGFCLNDMTSLRDLAEDLTLGKAESFRVSEDRSGTNRLLRFDVQWKKDEWGNQYSVEFVIDPSRGYLLVDWLGYEDGRLDTRETVEEIVKHGTDIWFPRPAVWNSYTPDQVAGKGDGIWFPRRFRKVTYEGAKEKRTIDVTMLLDHDSINKPVDHTIFTEDGIKKYWSKPILW